MNLNRSSLALYAAALLTIGISVLASVATVKWMAQRPVSGITTHSITVVDSANHTIARLSSEQDVPALTMFDKQRRKRAAFFLEEESGAPDIYLYDATGKARAALNLFDNGMPNLAYMAGVDSAPFAITKYTPEGNFSVVIREVDNKSSHRTGTLDFSIVNGKPQLKLMDGAKRIVWQTP